MSEEEKERRTDRNGDKPEGGVTDDDIDSVQDAEEEEDDGFFRVESWDTRPRSPSLVFFVCPSGGEAALLVPQEDPCADGTAEGVDGGESIRKRKVDEHGLVVKSEGEIEEEIEGEPVG